jgi:hypothetical protein
MLSLCYIFDVPKEGRKSNLICIYYIHFYKTPSVAVINLIYPGVFSTTVINYLYIQFSSHTSLLYCISLVLIKGKGKTQHASALKSRH